MNPLSARELEVIKLLADGKTRPEVAAILGISPQTAKNHGHAIFQKLGISTLSQLVKYSIANGITTAESWQ